MYASFRDTRVQGVIRTIFMFVTNEIRPIALYNITDDLQYLKLFFNSSSRLYILQYDKRDWKIENYLS